MVLWEVLVLRRIGRFVVALAVAGCPGLAAAQSPADEQMQLPDITVSVSFGSHFRTDYSGFSGPATMLPGSPGARWALDLGLPVTVASFQLPLTRSILFESDFLTARTDGQGTAQTAVDKEFGTRGACVIPCEAFVQQQLRESRSVFGAGANLLVRVGPPRLAILFGAGLGVQRTSGRLDTTRTCEVVVAGGCVDYPDESGSQQSSSVTLRPRVLYGVEAVVAPRLVAFSTMRWGGLGAAATYDDSDFPGTALVGGVRVALRTRPGASQLVEVTLTQADGVKHRGRLVSLTSDAVVLREDGRDRRLSLADVRTIDKVGRHTFVGALIGTAYATAGWLAVGMTRDSCADCEDGPLAASIMTPVAIGAGAGIGALVEQLTRGRRRLYPSPPGTALRLAPVVAKGLTGARIGLVW